MTMASNVKFIRTTKLKWVNRDSYDMNALYFLTDTGELCRGDQLLSDGARMVDTYADLPEFDVAADGILYFTQDTHNAYMMSPTRDSWIQAIYATVSDIESVPEEVIDEVVPTVAAVLSVKSLIATEVKTEVSDEVKAYVDESIVNSTVSNLTPVDGTITITDVEDGGKAIGVAISTDTTNALTAVEGGLFVSKMSAGDGIDITDNKVSVKLADDTHGLVAVDGTLTLNLATKDSDGAMSKEDKAFIDAIPSVYVARKYEISGAPTGTLVNYGEKEIRIMIPADTDFAAQESAVSGAENMFYIKQYIYAPKDAVRYRVNFGGTVTEGAVEDFAGCIDECGRTYLVTTPPVAYYDTESSVWVYYGSQSKTSHYIGWNQIIEWFDEEGVCIANDSIRINLSNEDCHTAIEPYYVNALISTTEAEELKATVAALEESYSWQDM